MNPIRVRAGGRERSRLRLALRSLALASSLSILPLPSTAAPAGAPGTAPPGVADTTDWLSWAEAAFAVRPADPPRSEAHLVALDGDPATTGIGIPRHAPLPHSFVVELPAPTTFRDFGVPELNEFGPAKGKHVKTVEIEGSDAGPETGFAPLATFVIEIERGGPQRFPVAEPRPVRWLRITFVDRYREPEADFDGYLFSELMGFGEQEPRTPAPDAFTGVWSLRRAGSVSNNVLELRHEGTEIHGCQRVGGQAGTIAGSVVDGLARLVTTTPQRNGPIVTPSLAVVTSEGEIHGVASEYAGLRPFSGVPAAPGTTSPCPAAIESPNAVSAALAEGRAAIVYGIHFDVDSDALRPDAEPALMGILEALESNPGIAVTIEGHTDSDGTDDHNLDLSRRRAESVVAWLVERGVDGARTTAMGNGEAEPIADNASAAGKAMNRRVEVEPR